MSITLRMRLLLVLVGALAISVSPAAASPILLFNTGVDASGTPLADGTVGDPHYTLVTVPSGTTELLVRRAAGGFPIPPFIGDTALSAWVGPNSNTHLHGDAGTYVYRTTFDLTGLDPVTASITGGWTSDNQGLDILINGISTGFTTPLSAFSTGFFAFVINSGFVPGLNTLDFVVNNSAFGTTALRVEMTGSATAAVPEPTSMLLLATGLVGLLARSRGKSRSRAEAASARS